MTRSRPSTAKPNPKSSHPPSNSLKPAIWHGCQIIGDSIAKGILSEGMPADDFSLCKSGNSIKGLHNELKAIDKLDSKHVIVHIGTNDVFSVKYDDTKIRPILTKIIRRLKELGAENILILRLRQQANSHLVQVWSASNDAKSRCQENNSILVTGRNNRTFHLPSSKCTCLRQQERWIDPYLRGLLTLERVHNNAYKRGSENRRP